MLVSFFNRSFSPPDGHVASTCLVLSLGVSTESLGDFFDSSHASVERSNSLSLTLKLLDNRRGESVQELLEL